MSGPAALVKAVALANHLKFATDRAQACVLLSDSEAFEFLDFMRGSYTEEFAHELDEAHALNDPWPMLESFEVLGFRLQRLQTEVH